MTCHSTLNYARNHEALSVCAKTNNITNNFKGNTQETKTSVSLTIDYITLVCLAKVSFKINKLRLFFPTISKKGLQNYICILIIVIKFLSLPF